MKMYCSVFHIHDLILSYGIQVQPDCLGTFTSVSSSVQNVFLFIPNKGFIFSYIPSFYAPVI